MSEDEAFSSDPIPTNGISHYHGDVVRTFFVVGAGLMFLVELLGTHLPFPTIITIGIIIILVVAAGVTNPRQIWIHWANVIISIACLILFGTLALTRLRTNAPITQSIYICALAILFVAAVYFATKTLRGILLYGPTDS